MSRILGIVVVIVLLVGAVLFYESPTIAFYDIRSAARSEDIQSLAKLIDFDAARSSLKTQLDAGDKGVEAPGPSPLNDPVGATGKAVKNFGDSIGKAWNDLTHPQEAAKPAPPPLTPDDYLKPRALLALTYGAGKDAATVDPEKFTTKPPAPKVGFFSLQHTRLTVKDPDRGTTTFTFERKGIFRWQLVHIGFPKPGEIEAEEAAAAASAASASAATQ